MRGNAEIMAVSAIRKTFVPHCLKRPHVDSGVFEERLSSLGPNKEIGRCWRLESVIEKIGSDRSSVWLRYASVPSYWKCVNVAVNGRCEIVW